MINILIVEKKLQYATEILNKLSTSEQNLRFCGIATSKESFYEFINNVSIDIFLIDLDFFNKIDYQYIQSCQNSIIFISHNEFFITKNYLDIPCFFMINEIEIQIKKLINQKRINFNNTILKKYIKKELDYLNYKSTYKGSLYLLEAIYIINTSNNHLKYNLTKDIYPIIAKKFNTSPLNVKYNIRNATEAMYFNCEEDKLCEYLGYNVLETPKTKDIIDIVQNKINESLF